MSRRSANQRVVGSSLVGRGGSSTLSTSPTNALGGEPVVQGAAADPHPLRDCGFRKAQFWPPKVCNSHPPLTAGRRLVIGDATLSPTFDSADPCLPVGSNGQNALADAAEWLAGAPGPAPLSLKNSKEQLFRIRNARPSTFELTGRSLVLKESPIRSREARP